jgi:hypothetical protein
MLKLVRRYRGKSSDSHIKDKLGQELFLFNKVKLDFFYNAQLAIAVLACDMCLAFSVPF